MATIDVQAVGSLKAPGLTEEAIPAEQYVTNVTTEVFPDSSSVKILSDKDFFLSDADANQCPINLRNRDDKQCAFVYFYDNSRQSLMLLNVFVLLAKQMSGNLFGTVQLMSPGCAQISTAFTELSTDYRSFCNNFQRTTVPFLLVYHGQRAVGAYNGELSTRAMGQFIITDACNPAYEWRQENPGALGAYFDIKTGVSARPLFTRGAKAQVAQGTSTAYTEKTAENVEPKNPGITDVQGLEKQGKFVDQSPGTTETTS